VSYHQWVLGWDLFAVGLAAVFAGGSVVLAGELTVVPFWDGETATTPDGPLVNRYGGASPNQFRTSVSRTTSTVHSGTGGYRIDTVGSIPAGSFGFFQPALTGSTPSSAYGVGRDISRFEASDFWLKNDTGSPFTLKFEIKDYRDSGSHLAYRTYSVPSSSGWQQYSAPLDLADPDWTVVGSPDLGRARYLAFVLEANQGQAINGSLYLDDMVFVEPGGPIDVQAAPLDVLAERIARRQWDGLWGSRNRTNGLIPAGSTTATVGALNATSAVLKMLPGAVGRGWVNQSDADAYVTQLVGAFNTIMDAAVYVPPRYFDSVTLAPVWAQEESSVDAAFMALALHQYKSLATTSAAMQTSIQDLVDRFNFAAFSDMQQPTTGWKLAYQYGSGQFTAGTYDGYSGEPWLISLAAQLAETNRIDIATHWNSAVFRQQESLVDADNAHLVHSFPEWRAPFLQWLLPLFVDVSQRGIDTYPDRTLASNPLRNAVRYQEEVDAYFASLGRALFLQPDAGSNGPGTAYNQYSAYDDHGEPELFMPWSVAFSLLGDPAAAEAALRNHLDRGLQGPLGLSDSVHWATGAADPNHVTARHDFWNTALSTMALLEYLFQDNAFFTALPEVAAALDQVFFPLGDMDFDDDVDFDDIDDFVLGLTNGALYENQYLVPADTHGDLDLDGDIDFDDIDDFVAILANPLDAAAGQRVPEPASVVLFVLAALAAGFGRQEKKWRTAPPGRSAP